jgi:Ca2+-binding EF-hand superfamily protein
MASRPKQNLHGGGLQKSSSLPQLATAKPPQVYFTKDAIPPALRSMEYFKVVEYFRMFDTNKNGNLDREEFYRFMKAICQQQPISKAACNDIFSTVDVDNSGEIDQEEFLSWCFSMHNEYCGGVSERLRSMDRNKVIEYFKRVDTNGNGQLDMHEFYHFISRFASDANMSRQDSNRLFAAIDTDKSGEIDAKEFLNWVFPAQSASKPVGPRTGLKNQPSAQGKTAGKGEAMPVVSTKSGKRLPEPVADEARPRQAPIVLEFTIGPDYEYTAWAMGKSFKKEFNDTVQLKIVMEPKIKGCRKLVVLVGRGIVLWDRYTMIAHSDDPFQSFESSKVWVADMIRKRLPTFLRAAAMSDRA